MAYPKIYFADSIGELPWEDHVQHTRQYSGRWYVQIEGLWDGSVGLKGDSIIPLLKISSNRWEIPQRTKHEREISKGVASRTGQITAILLDASGEPVDSSPEAFLLVKPAGLTEQELEQLITEIGLLALSTSSCVTSQLQVPVGENVETAMIGMGYSESRGLLLTATSLLKLASVVQSNWVLIEKRPLRSFSRELGLVDTRKLINSPQVLIKAKIDASKQRIMALTQVESTQCSENEFLCYVLDVYLKDLVNGIVNSLEHLEVNDSFSPLNYAKEPAILSFLARAKEQVQKFNQQREEDRKTISKIVAQLQECAEWATEARHSPILGNVLTPTEPPLPSQRLIGSPAYAPIFEEYMNCESSVFSKIQPVLTLFKATYQSQVRSTWELYEIWCFVRLYNAFVINLNMRPPLNEATLFESMRIEKGEIKIPTNNVFRLQGAFDDGSQFNISLWYQPKQYTKSNHLRIPDIRVDISSNSETKTYYFDAKYRNYKLQGRKQFVYDVIDVARDKYLYSLRGTASFILHTDRQIDFWGEVPINRVLKEKFDRTLVTSEDRFISHKYGAIALQPGVGANRQLNRLIRLMFQYHGSFSTDCLFCGHKLNLEQDTQTSWIPSIISQQELTRRVISGSSGAGKGTGLYCSCPKCGQFWVVQHCYGKNHRILKFPNCFHRHSDRLEHKGKWMYICPVCGSDPSGDKLN
ncbi:nuclease domain-containing protein [Merismopedia glauca]|uniref:DUF2357 domain-containing protein n=1 Tax=Merismopedia glauca CCAP 1448/3 TaxID=1296344 RepID=A0A2T1BY98_9CYAN|nr:nuclease domain-containing protein [Merismopedia glauca]PSB01000.1 hypothetical protein C7B64_20610 [Merismopedia glauca CCAP 1448/3]